MATTSSTSSITSSASTGGGMINVDAVVSGLMSIERQPIDKLNTKEASFQAKITALGTLKSKVSALQTAAQKLGNASTSSLLAYKATSSDSSIFTATAASTAVAGTYSLAVTTLAQSQKLVAAGQASSTAAIGDGTSTVVTFDFGTISGGTLTNGVYSGAGFASNGSGTASITIDSSNNTLQGIRDAINAANMGVSATIVNDGSGTPYRLALSSGNTGVSNSIKITTDGANAAIDTLLAHDPAGTQRLSETVTAKNAVFDVNGITVSKASNTVTDAIDGVTLNLSKTTTAPVTLTVERDVAAASKAVTDLVAAYNDLYTAMKNSFAYKSGSALAGEQTLRAMQTQMREIVATAASGGSLTHLLEVGITTTTAGTMEVDAAKLNTALSSNFSNTAKLFNSTTGFATRFDAWAGASLAYNGTFTSRTDSLNSSIKAIAEQKATLETRMIAIEKRYRNQFSSLNATLISMNQTSTYLTQQLSRLK